MHLPLTARANEQYHLEMGGCDVVALAREHGTPLYIYDDAHLRARAREIANAFQPRWHDTLILYATKAYFSPYLARLCKDAGLGVDVTSVGELEIAHRVDFPREKIYLHGNNKTAAEIRAALAMQVEHIVVDNLPEIELLARVAHDLDAYPRVLLRLAPGIDPHTHRYLATGVAESKFGLPIAPGDAQQAAHRVMAHAPRLKLVGLHVHIGSQVFQVDPYCAAAAQAIEFARELQNALGFELEELDLGGGWGVAYTEKQETLDINTLAHAIVDTLSNSQSSTRNFRLLLEPGRALVAQSAVAVYTIGAIKEIPGVRTYVAVDGGMGDNLRPALYGAEYTACVANKMNQEATQRVAIAGRYCEQGDVLIEDVALPRVEPGDLIAVPCAGAYQIPMSSNYNWVPRPAVLAVRDGQARVIRRRETIDDLLRCEVDE